MTEARWASRPNGRVLGKNPVGEKKEEEKVVELTKEEKAEIKRLAR